MSGLYVTTETTHFSPGPLTMAMRLKRLSELIWTIIFAKLFPNTVHHRTVEGAHSVRPLSAACRLAEKGEAVIVAHPLSITTSSAKRNVRLKKFSDAFNVADDSSRYKDLAIKTLRDRYRKERLEGETGLPREAQIKSRNVSENSF